MSCSVQIGCHQHIGQQIVICLHHKRRVHEVLIEVLCDTPFQREELQLRAMVFLLQQGQGVASESNRMIMSITLLLGEHHPSPSLEASISTRNGLSKSGNTRMGVDWTFLFKMFMASHTSGGRSTGPIFTSFPSMSYKGCTMLVNPLINLQ